MTPEEIALQLEVERLYTRYAAAIDELRLDDWCALFCEDCFYAIVPRDNAAEAGIAQGATMNHIVKITTYLTDIRYRVDLAPIREEFFGKKGPASTLVEISSLAHPDWMIEIEAIAVL